MLLSGKCQKANEATSARVDDASYRSLQASYARLQASFKHSEGDLLHTREQLDQARGALRESLNSVSNLTADLSLAREKLARLEREANNVVDEVNETQGLQESPEKNDILAPEVAVVQLRNENKTLKEERTALELRSWLC